MTFRGKSDLYYQNWQLNKEKGIISQSGPTCKHTKFNSVVKLKINKRFFFLNSKTWEQWTLDFFFLWSNCKNRDSKYGVGKESRKATLARTPAPFDTQIRHTRDRVGKNDYLIPTIPENSKITSGARQFVVNKQIVICTSWKEMPKKDYLLGR